MVILTSKAEVKLRGTLAEATVLCMDWSTRLCMDWATRVDTFAGAKERHTDWVQALCTLVVEMLHGTCCFDSPEKPVHSQALVWENSRVDLWFVCSRASQCFPVRLLEAQAS